MKSSTVCRYVFGICAAAILAGCGGGSNTPFGPSSNGITAERTLAKSPYKVLYSFKGSPDGQWPIAGLVSLGGTFYGTTPRGGSQNCDKIKGCGTIFSMTASGKETVLDNFDGTNGSEPAAPLLDVNGTLYGTTAKGGANCTATGGCGTVFSITPSGTETVLYSFKGYPSDGADPANLIDVNGTLYGTTSIGGSGSCTSSGTQSGTGCGTVFAITASGNESVLYSFGSAQGDGDFPNGGLVDLNGTLYGTTALGGANGNGTVFAITASGAESVLHSFNIGNHHDGAYPLAGLINVSNTLYGTTGQGGANELGAVFSITPSGGVTVLYSFSGLTDGISPNSLLLSAKGKLYGTTSSGGTDNYGTVFSLAPSGSETVLYSFRGQPDGGYPDASLIEVNNKLYGTTQFGGSKSCTRTGESAVGCGTVFALSP